MAFAFYTNDRRTADQGRVLGCFTEVDFGQHFEFAERFGFPEDFHPEMPHVVFVGRGETRLAHVKKTVLKMVHDDDVVEQWMIKGRREY